MALNRLIEHTADEPQHPGSLMVPPGAEGALVGQVIAPGADIAVEGQGDPSQIIPAAEPEPDAHGPGSDQVGAGPDAGDMWAGVERVLRHLLLGMDSMKSDIALLMGRSADTPDKPAANSPPPELAAVTALADDLAQTLADLSRDLRGELSGQRAMISDLSATLAADRSASVAREDTLTARLAALEAGLIQHAESARLVQARTMQSLDTRLQDMKMLFERSGPQQAAAAEPVSAPARPGDGKPTPTHADLVHVRTVVAEMLASQQRRLKIIEDRLT